MRSGRVLLGAVAGGALIACAACGPKSAGSAAEVDARTPADATMVRDAAARDAALPPDWWARTYRLAAAGQPDEAGTALLLALDGEAFPVAKAREAFHDPRLAEVMKNPVVRSRLSRMGVRVPEVDAHLSPKSADAGVRAPR
ncbi:MAG: hypothetical protein H6704_26585 [Myxococcales bacterium]|nr:hypothetical protein [Myxococcales bacterium]